MNPEVEKRGVIRDKNFLDFLYKDRSRRNNTLPKKVHPQRNISKKARGFRMEFS